MHRTLEIIDAVEPRAERARQEVMRVAPLAGAILFGGDRWAVAMVCAIAMQGDALHGLATLAPTDELGRGGPHVIGVWVARAHRRQGVGSALLRMGIAESRRRYQAPPTAVVCTPSGLALCARLQDNGLTVQVSRGMLELD